jgi:hypothetical protein
MQQPTERPNNARMVDYVLGGSHHFAIDRQAAEQVLKVFPDGPELVRAQRRFLQRAVAWMAEEQAIDRFLDFGSGLPSSGNVHEVAREIHPAAQVVYTDQEPITVAYSSELLRGEVGVSYIEADVTSIQSLLSRPEVARLRESGKPVGVTLVGIGMYIPPDTLASMLHQLYDWLPVGSTLALVLMGPEANDHPGIQIYRSQGFTTYTQTHEQVRALLGSWRPTAEGIVSGLAWRYPEDTKLAQALQGWTVVVTR